MRGEGRMRGERGILSVLVVDLRGGCWSGESIYVGYMTRGAFEINRLT